MGNIKKIKKEIIEQFMNGDDPMERIVGLDYKYNNDFMTVFYRNENDNKCILKDPFRPFLWATRKTCLSLCGGNRQELKSLMAKYSIGVKKLTNISIEGDTRTEFEDGYMFIFYAKKPMSYSMFLNFFKKAGNPVYKGDFGSGNDDDKDYLCVTPQEQYLISTGKRFFKGYNDYNDVLRMAFDLESEGLDTEKCRITSIGIRFNRPFPKRPEGFSKIFNLKGDSDEEKDKCELEMIENMMKIIYTFKPDVICAHNGENFDWKLIIGACKRLGTSIEEMSAKYFNGNTIHKETRETVLKLGGETEVFNATVVPYTIVTDSLHAVRRAQAIDSNMRFATLKYAMEYSGMKKENRVYTPGNMISDIQSDKERHYAFNDSNGDWYLYDADNGENVLERSDFNSDHEYSEYIKSITGLQSDGTFRMYKRNKLIDGYELVSGDYIIDRYLLDDIYEGDKVEWKYNSTNFLICKMLPVPFKKCTTMGTAGQWKALMMAWSYKFGLAIPPLKNTPSFTGGLSRLLKTGYVKNVVKLDYNSLYPSIILTWGIHDRIDLTNGMLSFLEYILTTREYYKGLKKKANKILERLSPKLLDNTITESELKEYRKAEADFSLADSKQMQMKILANSFFGAFGALNGAVYPWKSRKCAEQTTCTGRQCLRLMISHFHDIGNKPYTDENGNTVIADKSEFNEYMYEPIVGDSFTGDTPLFIKYDDNGLINIKPIEELINEEHIKKDILGREYDYSKKNYKVLCRSGWVEPSYIYRHETKKPIYRVEDGDMTVDVTEDHSLFDSKQEKIKPSEIDGKTELEYYRSPISRNAYNITYFNNLDGIAKTTAKIGRNIPIEILNASKDVKIKFTDSLHKYLTKEVNIQNFSKTFVAGYNFIQC